MKDCWLNLAIVCCHKKAASTTKQWLIIFQAPGPCFIVILWHGGSNIGTFDTLGGSLYLCWSIVAFKWHFLVIVNSPQYYTCMQNKKKNQVSWHSGILVQSHRGKIGEMDRNVTSIPPRAGTTLLLFACSTKLHFEKLLTNHWHWQEQLRLHYLTQHNTVAWDLFRE